MSPFVFGLATLAGLTFLTGGYTAGVMVGRSAREKLRRERDQALARSDEPTQAHESAELEAWLDRLRAETATLSGAVREVQGGAEALASHLARHFSPMAERERLARLLTELGATSRNDLPALLDGIARHRALRAVILTDDVGLLLASSQDARDADVIAGASSLLLTYVDRLEQAGLAVPLSILLHDDADRLTLHRIIHVQGRRYLLSAIGRQGSLALDSLDPAVDILERVLARDAWNTP